MPFKDLPNGTTHSYGDGCPEHTKEHEVVTPEEHTSRKSRKVYETVKSRMYKKANRFQKKHGNWLVAYAPKRQVVIMDTWNGYIYMAHALQTILKDDGYVDCQLKGRIHTVITEKEAPIEDAIKIYKALL